MRTSAAVQKRAKELRKEMTASESRIWEGLRDIKLCGLKFRRQTPLGPFIADLYCAAHHLMVEVDGDIHAYQLEADAARSAQFADFKSGDL